ncbi:MAG TPA: hypothetical protein VKH42_10735, partial [Vicinamibacterales bacterium]|nr:hypothetical protein [Vicinamibacterales bacterium]
MKTFAFVCLAAVAVSVEGQRNVEVWRQKLAAITEEGDRPSKQGRRTVVTQSDLNAYLQYDAQKQLPAGVVE